MSDGSLDKLLQRESPLKPQNHLNALEKILETKLLANELSDEERAQYQKWNFLCGFVITVWNEIHKLFQGEVELEEANVFRTLHQSAFLIANFVKYKNSATFESEARLALSSSLRGLGTEIPRETIGSIISPLQEVIESLRQSAEQEIRAETLWEFLNAAAKTLLEQVGEQKIRLYYLWDNYRVRQSDNSSEADLLLYELLERRIVRIRKIVEENRERIPKLRDDSFVRQLHVPAWATVPEGRTINVVFNENFSKNTTSKVATKLGYIIMSKVERLPLEYFTWVPLKSNYKVTENDLRNEPISLPFLEDNLQKEVYKKLLQQKSPMRYSDLFPLNSSRMNTEKISLANKLFDIGYKLTQFILRKDPSDSTSCVCSYSSVCAETYLPQKGGASRIASSNAEDACIRMICDRLCKGSNYTKYTSEKSSCHLDNFDQIQSLGSGLRKWFCRKCYTYACGEHLPLEVSLPQKFFNLAYERNTSPVLSPPCGNVCFYNGEVSSKNSFYSHVWTNQDVHSFQAFWRVFGSNWCDLATVFFQRHTCYECAFFAESTNFSRKRAAKKNGQRKKNQSNRKPTVTLMDHIHCSHDGDECNSDNCSCMKSELYCERYCPCHLFTQGNCRNRATFCSCKNGKCLNGQCPCFKENRECDPDTCLCFASCRSEGGKQEDSKYTCKNIGIRTKAHKRLFIAPSDNHQGGWGLFTTEPIEKYEFVCEYKGELVSLEECERRERSYQAVTGMTFVFKKGEVHIDATRKGGKARFANEPRKKRSPNCYTRYKRTMGDLRVGIYADRNIQAGEEILFKYEC